MDNGKSLALFYLLFNSQQSILQTSKPSFRKAKKETFNSGSYLKAKSLLLYSLLPVGLVESVNKTSAAKVWPRCFSFNVYLIICLHFLSPSLFFIVFLLLFYFYLFIFRTCCVACEILVPQPAIEPLPPASGAQSLNHWTAREVPDHSLNFKSKTTPSSRSVLHYFKWWKSYQL